VPSQVGLRAPGEASPAGAIQLSGSIVLVRPLALRVSQ
jgi:hypothetical protein